MKEIFKKDEFVHVVLDNAKIHKKEVVEVFKQAGIYSTYSIPYSPQLNGIERCFSKVKGMLSKILTNNEIFRKEMNKIPSWKPKGTRTNLTQELVEKIIASSLLSVGRTETLNNHLKTLKVCKLCEENIPLRNDYEDAEKIQSSKKLNEIFDYRNVKRKRKIVEVKNKQFEVIDINGSEEVRGRGIPMEMIDDDEDYEEYISCLDNKMECFEESKKEDKQTHQLEVVPTIPNNSGNEISAINGNKLFNDSDSEGSSIDLSGEEETDNLFFIEDLLQNNPPRNEELENENLKNEEEKYL